ncbi:glycerophosphodiester phosphodiesterase [Baekduia soli]|uniref:glycerophosphodiester phosphodiesterase n=1 Tax=Baekduia soli TaxID=496014 RepID=UPI001652838C|nr:glycerophosphodiester phosphodiesterase [Baekduia soli]
MPFLVAHRAGNDLGRLRRAESLGIPLIEADVHLFAGRLEVRHLKTVGPLPILWDRWELAPPWRPRLLLGDLLATAAPPTELMLDLKGRDPRLARAVAACLDRHGDGRRVTVCSRTWRLLRPLEGRPDVRVVHSVGSRRQLAALRRLLGYRAVDGVSIHRRLLDAPVTAALKRDVGLLVSWPVETAEEARRLAAWGVDGLITTRFDALAGVLAGGEAA